MSIFNFKPSGHISLFDKDETSEKLFENFRNYLHDLGLYVNEGKIVNAGFVEVPKQRNSKEN